GIRDKLVTGVQTCALPILTSIAYSPVTIQAHAQSAPALPCWFGEITLIVHHLQRQGVLAAIEEQVRFARRRFGRYEVIDFLAVRSEERRVGKECRSRWSVE